MTDKAQLFRALLTVAEHRTADPALFAAVCRLARTEGATLAFEAVEALAGHLETAALEEAVFAAASARLDGRRDQLRRDGVGENEVAAFTVQATLTLIGVMQHAVAEFQQAARAPIQ